MAVAATVTAARAGLSASGWPRGASATQKYQEHVHPARMERSPRRNGSVVLLDSLVCLTCNRFLAGALMRIKLRLRGVTHDNGS